MYLLQKTNDGYAFETARGVKYEVYFAVFEDSYNIFPNNSNKSNYFYFGIERMSPKLGGIDSFIRSTILFTIVPFFIANPNAVLIFNYDNDDKRLNARRRLFKRWFDEFSIHTLYKLYQHDFSDLSTVCALYRRTGVDKFHLIQKNIQDSISNIRLTQKL
jgi:hypothetical protein